MPRLLLLGDIDGATTTTDSLGVFTTHMQAAKMSKTAMRADHLQALQIVTKFRDQIEESQLGVSMTFFCCSRTRTLYCRWLVMMVATFLTSFSVHSPARLVRSISAFFKTMLEQRRPTPLMAIMARSILHLPSMFVFMIRKMCWNFYGTFCQRFQKKIFFFKK